MALFLKGKDYFSHDLLRVVKNVLYLMLTQGVTYLSPLIIAGILIKELGVNEFGKYATLIAFSMYAQILIDYGFAFTSSREIAANRQSTLSVAMIYKRTQIIKILLSIMLVPFFLLYPVINKDKTSLDSAICIYILVVSNALMPVWYYQGLEKLNIYAIYNGVSKILSCVLVAVFVKPSSDISSPVLCQTLPSVIIVIIINYFIIKNLRKSTRFESLNLSSIKKQLIDGWPMFISTVGASLLSNSGITILSLFNNPGIVGQYAAAERVAKAIMALSSPITQAIYPYNCKNFSESESKGIRSVLITGGGAVIFCIVSVVFSYFILSFISGMIGLDLNSINILNVFLIWIVFSVINNVLGIQLLSASGNQRIYSNCFLIVSLLTISLMFLLSFYYSAIGTALAVLISEVALSILLIYCVRKKFSF